MTKNTKSFIKDAVVYGIGLSANCVLGVATIAILTRFLSPSEYGIIEILTSCITILSLFVIMGFEGAHSYFFFHFDKKEDQQLTLSIGLFFRFIISIILCTIGFLFSNQISIIVFGNATYSYFIILVFIGGCLLAFLRLFENIFRLKFKKKKVLLLKVGDSLGHLIFLFLFIALLKLGIHGFLLSRLLTLTVFVLLGFCMHFNMFKLTFSWERFKSMLFYAFPLFLGHISIWILRFSDRFFLLNMMSEETVGLYAVSLKFSSFMLLITMGFRFAWNPYSFSIAKDPASKNIYALVFKYYMVLLCFFTIILSIFSRELTQLVATEQFYPASFLVGWLSLNYILYEAIPFISFGCMLKKKTFIISLAYGIATILNLALNYVLIQYIGALGAVLATLFSLSLANIILYFFAQKYYYIPYKMTKVVSLFALTIMMASLANYIDSSISSNIALIKLLLLSAFIFLLFFFKMFKKEEFITVYMKIKSAIIPQ